MPHTQALTLDNRLNIHESNQLKIEALDMDVGETTYHTKCPRCGHKGSFSVTRENNGILYHCFRHKCGVRGYIPTMASSAFMEQPARKKEFTPSPFKGDLEAIPADIHKWLLETYAITKEDCRKNNWMYDRAGHRLAMPINNLYGYRAGLACKKLPDSPYTGPKVVNYWEVDDRVKLHFPKTDSELNKIVIVEDILSATKLAHILPSVALLGTNMTKVQAAFIAKNYRHAVVLLDPDATVKAVKLRMEYGAMFSKMDTIALAHDPKDTSMRNLEMLFGEHND